MTPFQPHRLMQVLPRHPLADPSSRLSRIYVPKSHGNKEKTRHGYCDNKIDVYTPEIMETTRETAKDTAFRLLHTLKQYWLYPGQQQVTRTGAGDKEQGNEQP